MRLELYDVPFFGSLIESLCDTVERPAGVFAERNAKLLAGRGVTVKNRDSRIPQVRDDSIFLAVSCIKEPQNASGKIRRDAPAKRKPQGTTARVTQQTSPEVGTTPIFISALI
jgi:hypothetical protein